MARTSHSLPAVTRNAPDPANRPIRWWTPTKSHIDPGHEAHGSIPRPYFLFFYFLFRNGLSCVAAPEALGRGGHFRGYTGAGYARAMSMPPPPSLSWHAAAAAAAAAAAVHAHVQVERAKPMHARTFGEKKVMAICA